MKKNLLFIVMLIIFLSTPLYAHVHGKEINQSQGIKQSFENSSAVQKNPIRAKAGNNKFKVVVSISKQKVFIYKNNKLIKSIICSTGLPEGDNKTPIGHFKIDDYYGLGFYNNKYEEGAKYWVGFIGAQYLFHSVPTNEKGEIIKSQVKKLGTKASHGCIRMPVNDSLWFYETIPQGTDVIIKK